MSRTIIYKEPKDLIVQTFFECLRPEVPTLEFDNVQDWLLNNMGMDHIYFMYHCIVQIDEWLKKKGKSSMMKLFPSLTQQSQEDTSQKNSTPQPEKLPTGQLLDLT